jgi:hypothetical protein
MKTRNSRWMKWILAESARPQVALPSARGATRAAFIARRADQGKSATPTTIAHHA